MLEKILAEADLKGSETLFGYHKDFFANIADHYELKFWDDDTDYPHTVKNTNVNVSYTYPIYS